MNLVVLGFFRLGIGIMVLVLGFGFRILGVVRCGGNLGFFLGVL